MNERRPSALVMLMLLLAGVASGCGGPLVKDVLLVGDPRAIGAVVYLDGAKVGWMTAWSEAAGPVVRGSVRDYGIARCVEVGDTILRAGETQAKIRFRARHGQHFLKVVSVGGDTVSGAFVAADYPRLEVSFRCRALEQIDW